MALTPTAFLKFLASTAADRYQPLGHYARYLARGKLGGDPVFAHILANGLLHDRSRILDIGCGRGLLTSWLLALQTSAAATRWPDAWPPAPCTSHIRGIELMAHDVARAKLALAPAIRSGHASFEQADICNADFGRADAVVILDVLHYVSIAAQDDILQRARNSLAPGGVLLLRVGNAAGGVPFVISTWIDQIVTTLRGLRVERLHCRTQTAWESVLKKLGFVVEAQAMSQGTPFANVLLIARLPVAA